MIGLKSDGFQNQKQPEKELKHKKKSDKKTIKNTRKHMIFIEKTAVFAIIKE